MQSQAQETCSYCAGLGAIEKRVMVGSGDWRHSVVVNETCGSCGGSGHVTRRKPTGPPPPPPDPIGTVIDWDDDGPHKTIPAERKP